MFFGNTLKKIRKTRKLTQEELASKLGVTKQTIINYEKSRTEPTQEFLKEIAIVLNVTPSMLQSPEISGAVDYTSTKKSYLEDYKNFITIANNLKKETYESLHCFLLEQLNEFSNKELFNIIEREYLENIKLLEKKEILHQIAEETGDMEILLKDKTSLMDFEINDF